MIVKKVTKSRGLSGGAFSARGREQSPLRPYCVEKMPPCYLGCPSGNDIREFITAIAQAERLGQTSDQAFQRAWEAYTETSPFPAVCGRVCQALCEAQCNRTKLEGAISINKIERAIGDFGIEKGLKLKMLSPETRPQKVAVIGAGPNGLTCAYQLRRRGYAVTVFEPLDAPGSVVRWGLSRDRVPQNVLDAEIQRIVDLGVELQCGVTFDQNGSLEALRKSYDAVHDGLGAPRGYGLGFEVEDATNVFSGFDFIGRYGHAEACDLGQNAAVIVVGGGDTAIDAACLGQRLGANVTLLYRQSIEDMPVIRAEVEAAGAQGIKTEFLVAPVGVQRDGPRVTAVRCVRMKPGEPDDLGRRRPVAIPGSEFDIPAGVLVSTRLDLVTVAIGQGRRAAEAIDCKFLGKVPANGKMPVIRTDRMRLDHYQKMDRGAPAQAGQGFTRDQAILESQRCMSCGYCFGCEKCWMFCPQQGIVKPMQKGALYTFKLQNCTGCRKCCEECPCGFIDMQ